MPDGMSPESPKILIASKNTTIDQMKGSGSMPERNEPIPSFWELQNELSKLKDRPDKDREDKLKLQRARLLNEAKSIGVFDTIKPLLSEIQAKFEFDKAHEEIKNIDINALEVQAKGLHGWKDQYSGMIEHYRDGALRNMEIALYEATGNQKDPRATELKKEKELLGWGIPPQGLSLLVKKDLSQKETAQNVGVGIDTRDLAQKIAEAQGIPDWTREMASYIDAEDYLTAPFKLEPGKEPRFWIYLDEKEKLNWYVRSQVEISAYLKSIAASTEDLYMDKMKDFAVGLSKRYLKMLFGSRKENGPVEYEGMEGVLPAVGIYATIIGGEKFIHYKDNTDLSLKEVFCKVLDDKDLKEGLERDYGIANLRRLEKEGSELYKTCADSMYPHNNKARESDKITGGTPISYESFRKLRESIRFWLATKGRDLLLTDEEVRDRRGFFEGNRLKNKDRELVLEPKEKVAWEIMTDTQRREMDKELVYRLIRRRARDAEQIAWNFIYSSSLLECFDSRDYRPAGTKRHGPSSYWALFQWTPMHLQERWEQKIFRTYKREGEKGIEAKEEWAGNLGTWALNNKDRWQKRINKNGDVVGIVVPQILPDTLIRSALHTQACKVGRLENGKLNEYYDRPTDEKGRVKDEENHDLSFRTLDKIGDDVLNHPETVTRADLESRINWADESDSPFVPYIYDEMRWVDVIQQFFKKGQGAKVSLQDLGEAARNLRISKEDREKLLMVYFGNDVKSRKLKPKESPISWRIRMVALKEYLPNLFLER